MRSYIHVLLNESGHGIVVPACLSPHPNRWELLDPGFLWSPMSVSAPKSDTSQLYVYFSILKSIMKVPTFKIRYRYGTWVCTAQSCNKWLAGPRNRAGWHSARARLTAQFCLECLA